jgi:hypothetical protein
MIAESTSPRKRYFVFIVCVAWTMFAHAQASAPSADQSWTATSQTVTSNSNPLRATESHTQSGNRTVDKKTVEIIGPNGKYQPYFEVETETIQESPTVRRSITRQYDPDSDGHEQLTQITEAETQTSDAVTRTVQTTSNTGYDRQFHMAEREITVTTKSSESQKTQTTVYQPNMSGDLAPTMQTNEQQTQSPDGRVDTKKETLLADTYGGWQVYEVREQTVTGEARNRTSDERVYRRDFEGNVSPVSEVITKDTNVNGQLTSTTENYSADVPGQVRDQSLHLLQTSTTVQTTKPDRIVTEQQVLRPDPGEKDLNTVVNTRDILTKGSSGDEETITVTARYPDGYPSVLSVETRKSDRVTKKERESKP